MFSLNFDCQQFFYFLFLKRRKCLFLLSFSFPPFFPTNPNLGVFKVKINFLLIVISQLERPIVIFLLFIFWAKILVNISYKISAKIPTKPLRKNCDDFYLIFCGFKSLVLIENQKKKFPKKTKTYPTVMKKKNQ